MKPLAQLTSSELQDVVSFKVKSLILYYSLVTSIDSGLNTLVYNGTLYSAPSEVLEVVIKGKARYEAYALMDLQGINKSPKIINPKTTTSSSADDDLSEALQELKTLFRPITKDSYEI